MMGDLKYGNITGKVLHAAFAVHEGCIPPLR